MGRSFEPILRLLALDHTPECQYWAVWALANLTRVYGKPHYLVKFLKCKTAISFLAEKYCRLLKDENGFQMLEDLIRRTNHSKVRHYAKIALESSLEYLERSAVLGDGNADDLEG